MLDSNCILSGLKENERIELPIFYPSPIYYSLNTALNLSIVLTIPESYKWFYNCMLQLAFNKNWEMDHQNHPLDIYPANMIRIGRHGESIFVHEHLIDIDGTIIKIERSNFLKRIVSWIKNGIYILTYADVSKLPGTKYYGQSEYIHDTLVFGYDNIKKNVKMLDFNEKGKLSLLNVPYSALEEAVYSPSKHSVLTLINPRRNSTYEFNLELYKEFIEDYYLGKNTANRYSHILNIYGDYWWGLNIYEPFKEFVKYSKCELKVLDYRPFHALYEHKKCMLLSVEYLENNHIINNEVVKISDNIKNLVSKADILRMRALKFNISANNMEIEKIMELLAALESEEKLILHNLLDVLEMV